MDWYPWGEEALAKARAEDKPILLSIGYAACHWCHVMAHEIFENEEIARLMNELFVSIKVDREERPDLDAIYMEAVQAMTGSRRLADDRLPDTRRRALLRRHILPAAGPLWHARFPRVLRGVADLYRNAREDVERQAEAFREHYAGQAQTGLKLPEDFNPATATISAETLTRCGEALVGKFDRVTAASAARRSFRIRWALEFLLRVEARRRSTDASACPQPARRDCCRSHC